ncbi:hypothetical protein OIU78_024252 [Salix suchowensis]|nr:hypothetical protein OIU78_024252 [Salix suchowensis]
MKVNKICQIVRFKLFMHRWKLRSLGNRKSSHQESGSLAKKTPPAGYLAVYVGMQGRSGGLVLFCEAEFFEEVLRLLEKDETKFGRFGLEDFFKIVSSEVGFDSCKETKSSATHVFTPLLEKARV